MIRINMAKVEADLTKLQKSLTASRAYIGSEEVIKGIALNAATIIQSRTQRGIDSSGKAFQKYSPAYAEKKGTSGRAIGKVDLTLTGRMLNSMVGRFISYGRGAVVFSRAEESLKAIGNSARRMFFEVKLASELNALKYAALKLIRIRLKAEGL